MIAFLTNKEGLEGNDELFVVEELIGCATSFEPFAVVAVAEDAFVGITWLKSHFSPLWHLPRKKNWQTRGKGILTQVSWYQNMAFSQYKSTHLL